MKKFFFVVVLAFALLPATSFAQDGNNRGGNNNDQGLNPIRTITATEMSEIGVAVATFLGAVVYLGKRRRAQSK